MRNKLILLVLVCLGTVVPARAGTIEVAPTGTPSDILNVQAAMNSAQPGDTIVLKAGTFDWSGNTTAFSPFFFALGLPVTVSGITITGELGPGGEHLTERRALVQLLQMLHVELIVLDPLGDLRSDARRQHAPFLQRPQPFENDRHHHDGAGDDRHHEPTACLDDLEHEEP